jgi:5'-nucleotidase
MKKILLTNDDGHFSVGIMLLKEYLSENHEVYVVAPDRERSAISMALTLNEPLRIAKVSERIFSIDGTPADCINIAVQKIIPNPPDFIISGMNFGENLSEDVFFSGTVGAAFAGILYGIPAMAVSLLPRDKAANKAQYNTKNGAEITKRILYKLLNLPSRRVVYNVNIPFDNSGNIMLTSLGSKQYRPEIIEKKDPRGKDYYWIGTGSPVYSGQKGTDVWAIKNGHISLSIIDYNLNSRPADPELKKLFNEG